MNNLTERQQEIISTILAKRYIELELKTSLGMASSSETEDFNQLKELRESIKK